VDISDLSGKEVVMKWVALLLLVLIPVSLADAREVGKPMWGVKAGVTGSNLYGDDTGLFKTRFGGIFGASAEYPFTELVSIQAEILYAMKGWKNDDYYGGMVEISHSISQLEIPVLLRLNSPTEGPGPYLIMGPALFIGISDDFSVEVGGVTVPVDEDDFTVQSTQFGVVLGGGMEFPVDKYVISIEARGSVGATPAYEDIEVGSGTREVDAQHMCASLVVGVCF
jgi:hypothetical protein